MLFVIILYVMFKFLACSYMKFLGWMVVVKMNVMKKGFDIFLGVAHDIVVLGHTGNLYHEKYLNKATKRIPQKTGIE